MRYRIGITLIVLLSTIGCATTANYEKVLQSWIGAHVDRLVSSWGPPQNSYELSDGGHVIEYINAGTMQLGGFTYTQPQTTYHTGQASAYGANGGYAFGSYSGTSTTYVQKQTPIYNVPVICKTRFTVSSKGIITEWSWQGNNCVARPSDVPVSQRTSTNSIDDSDSFIHSNKYATGKTVRVSKEPFALYKEPSLSSERIGRIYMRDTLKIEADSGEWIKVKLNEDSIGWVKKIWVSVE
jgi:hypothetical protein